MVEFIRERAVRHEVRHERTFRLRGSATSCYRFPCDAGGNVAAGDLTPQARANLHACLAGRLDVIDGGVEVDDRWWVDPALIRCPCGAEVELAHFTNTCTRCGRDYDSGGSLLAPRDQWGEETGESPADILRIP